MQFGNVTADKEVKVYFVLQLIYFSVIKALSRTSCCSLCFPSSLRRLEDLQSQLAEEKDTVAQLNEQLQLEKSHKEQELKETRETHHSQISDLQEKIVILVSAVGQM